MSLFLSRVPFFILSRCRFFLSRVRFFILSRMSVFFCPVCVFFVPTAGCLFCPVSVFFVQLRFFGPATDHGSVASRAQCWCGFVNMPSSPLTRIESPLFRVLLQRRLSLPLPLSQRICGCGLPYDPFGHHRSACSRTRLGRRGFPLESAAARICREAGGRVATNMFVRNLDLGVPSAADNRRLEVVVDGLPLFRGVHLAVDTTLVSALKGDGVPRRGPANRDGVVLASARLKKTRTYPELVAAGARARLGAEDGLNKPAHSSSYWQRRK